MLPIAIVALVALAGLFLHRMARRQVGETVLMTQPGACSGPKCVGAACSHALDRLDIRIMATLAAAPEQHLGHPGGMTRPAICQRIDETSDPARVEAKLYRFARLGLVAVDWWPDEVRSGEGRRSFWRITVDGRRAMAYPTPPPKPPKWQCSKCGRHLQTGEDCPTCGPGPVNKLRGWQDITPRHVSCQCPAGPGKDCFLSADECRAREERFRATTPEDGDGAQQNPAPPSADVGGLERKGL